MAQIRGDWEALENRTECYIFQTFAYAQIWQKTVGEPSGATPLIAALRQGDAVVGIFPACRVLVAGVPILAWLGGPGLLDYGDVLFDATASSIDVDEFVGDALDALRREVHGALLYLTNVRNDAKAFGALHKRLRVYKQTAAPYVEIGDDYDAYLLSLDKNVRHGIRRLERRLAEAGETEYRMLAPGDPDLSPTMRRLIDLQHARFKRHLGDTKSRQTRYAAFRMEQASQNPHSRVATLRLNGTLIAASLHMVYRGRMYCLMPAFDPEYFQYSPGMLLQARVIETCFAEGLNPCDFCWGDEPYKYQWTKLDVPLTTFVSDRTDGALLVAVAKIARRIL
ncbi:MAG: GNAT family N-acetyltransferase [Coriobacteriia bacterium]|nr:GNAT family N-acetyltransferase [Coriobacteriia bacterium]